MMLVPLLILSGCIMSATPKESSLSLTWGANQTFSVNAMGSIQWYLDNAVVPGATTKGYTFQSGAHSLGQHTVKVASNFSGFKGERVWTITVNSPTGTAVPYATSCQDISNAGLICETVTTCSNTVRQGAVISQSPAPGTIVPAGATVTLTVSSGYCQTDVTVPAATSCAQILAAGLVCDTSYQCSNTVLQGSVIGQSPAAGTTVPAGTTVFLTLSSGPCTIEVPVPQASSCLDIDAAGLVCNETWQCSSLPKNSVISQSPAPGAMVAPGSDVFLTRSSGPCGTVVPNATTCVEIEAAGLVCMQTTACSNTVPAGQFIGLSPAPGTGVPEGSTVNLITSSGYCQVTVPAAANCNDITAVGLTCNTTTACSNTIPAGGVISQSPAAGAVVAYGSAVTLVLSSGQCAAQLATPQNVQATDVVLTSVTDPMQNHNLDNMVTITWNAVANATSYKIYRADTASGTYSLIGNSTTASYNDMQSETLALPAAPDTYTAANITAYEAAARPVISAFKNYKYYKVQACSSSSSYSDSDLSAADQGRMDYTLEEFYIIGKAMAGIPLMWLMSQDPSPDVGTDEIYYDPCGDGNVHWTITLSGVTGLFKMVFTNYVDSLDYSAGAINCSGTRKTIANGTIQGNLNLSGTGTLTGSVACTGNFSGKFLNISVPVSNKVTQPGTCTVQYNGNQVVGHVFTL